MKRRFSLFGRKLGGTFYVETRKPESRKALARSIALKPHRYSILAMDPQLQIGVFCRHRAGKGKALFIETSGLVRSARSATGWQFCPAARQRTNPRLHRRQRWEPLPRSERSGE